MTNNLFEQAQYVLIVAKCIVNMFVISINLVISKVLIVAKCIVNSEVVTDGDISQGINSSKVYCKCSSTSFNAFIVLVLIVAKCIVNCIIPFYFTTIPYVLIVAKCIVNAGTKTSFSASQSY